MVPTHVQKQCFFKLHFLRIRASLLARPRVLVIILVCMGCSLATLRCSRIKSILCVHGNVVVAMASVLVKSKGKLVHFPIVNKLCG